VTCINEDAVLAVVRYIEKQPLLLSWPKHWFDQRAYSRWAANEILGLMMDRPFESPVAVIEEFMIKMDYFSWVAKDSEAHRIFSIAADTAEDLLELIKNI